MNDVKYSVVIPVYNVEAYLQRCVDSILSQNYSQLEIILVDNGSTDRSGDICDQYAKTYSHILSFHIPNEGVSKARNFGLLKAKGDYIYFVDADDYVIGHLFKDLEPSLEDQVDVVTFSYYNSYEDGLKELSRDASILPVAGMMTKPSFIQHFQELMLSSMMYTVWNKLYRREFLQKNHLLFESFSLGEDVRFNLQVYRKLNSIHFSQSAYYVYISGRKDSAMGQYHPKRVSYQLDELGLILALFEEWGLTKGDFSEIIKSRILMSNIYNISLQPIPMNRKVNLVKEVCSSPELNELIMKQSIYLNRLVKMFLKYKMYRAVLLLKQIQKMLAMR